MQIWFSDQIERISEDYPVEKLLQPTQNIHFKAFLKYYPSSSTLLRTISFRSLTTLRYEYFFWYPAFIYQLQSTLFILSRKVERLKNAFEFRME